MENNRVLITGGLGFIGAHFVHYYRQTHPKTDIIVFDKNTYAADIDRIADLINTDHFTYIEGDISDQATLNGVFEEYQPTQLIHFAAESHVDNSIAGPQLFLKTNVEGTFYLLEAARRTWMQSPHELKTAFKNARFYHISTDEVFGSLGKEGRFNEQSNYAPNSPYSASKAAADHWVRSYFHTYGLPTLLSHCSNNYGPHQHNEKLIPTIIRTALNGEPIPLYGDGQNVRDWLYVEDHCIAIERILAEGTPGQVFCIGGKAELANLEICRAIVQQLDKLHPKENGASYSEQISFVKDRLGHDYRYAISATKIKNELGWEPKHSFEEGLKKTIVHYLAKYKNLS